MNIEIGYLGLHLATRYYLEPKAQQIFRKKTLHYFILIFYYFDNMFSVSTFKNPKNNFRHVNYQFEQDSDVIK